MDGQCACKTKQWAEDMMAEFVHRGKHKDTLYCLKKSAQLKEAVTQGPEQVASVLSSNPCLHRDSYYEAIARIPDMDTLRIVVAHEYQREGSAPIMERLMAREQEMVQKELDQKNALLERERRIVDELKARQAPKRWFYFF